MSKANLLDRRQVVSTLLADRKDVVAIGGLGASTNDMCAAGDHARNFYLWGGMGGGPLPWRSQNCRCWSSLATARC